MAGRTPDSRSAFTRFVDRKVRGGRQADIALPMSPGARRDPRLPPEPGGVGRSLKEAARGLKTVRELGRKR